MTFWVLAFFVCAASAASFPTTYQQFQKPVGVVANAQAEVNIPVVTPVEVARGAVKPYVTPVAVSRAAVKSYQTPYVTKPVVAVKSYADTVEVQPIKYATSPVKAVNYGNDKEAQVLRTETDVNAEGFNYNFETSNGIAAYSSGSLKNVDNTPAVVIEGSFQYLSPEGTPVQITYVADENGFQPRGDLLPQAPPVPEAIARALRYIEAHAQKEVAAIKKY